MKNSEAAARLVDSLSQRSPKPSLRRVELAGPKASEPMSRRTELSIDISSKQVESTGSAAGPSRFGLKRAEVLGHKTPEPVPRRTEITIVKPQESAHRRVETPVSKVPDVPAVPVTDAAPKRVEIQVPKPAEAPNCPPPPQTLENSEAPMSQPQSRLEPRPPPVAEVPYRNQEGEYPALGLQAVYLGLDLVWGSWKKSSVFMRARVRAWAGVDGKRPRCAALCPKAQGHSKSLQWRSTFGAPSSVGGQCQTSVT